LGLATPTAIAVGIGKAASQGVLIKNVDGLERACRVTTVVLDKTGTLTEGHPAVTDCEWLGNDLQRKLLYAIELRSEHPLATAVVDYLQESDNVDIDTYEVLPGRGVKAVVDGEQVLRFSPKYPQHILQTSTVELTMRETQQTMYALNLQPDKFKTSIDDAVNLEKINIADCTAFRNLKHVASTWDMQSMRLTDSPLAEGIKVITFARILK
jgi:cation transport ATPase